MWGPFSCCGSSSTPVTSSAAVMTSITPTKRKRSNFQNGDSHASNEPAEEKPALTAQTAENLKSALSPVVAARTLDTPASVHSGDSCASVTSSLRSEDDVTRRPIKCATSLKERALHSPLTSVEKRPLKVTRSLPGHRRRPPADDVTSSRTWRLRLSVRKARADFLRPIVAVKSPGAQSPSRDFERRLSQFRASKSDVREASRSSGALLATSCDASSTLESDSRLQHDAAAAATALTDDRGCSSVTRGKSMASSPRWRRHQPLQQQSCAQPATRCTSESRVRCVTSAPPAVAVRPANPLKVCSRCG